MSMVFLTQSNRINIINKLQLLTTYNNYVDERISFPMYNLFIFFIMGSAELTFWWPEVQKYKFQKYK